MHVRRFDERYALPTKMERAVAVGEGCHTVRGTRADDDEVAVVFDAHPAIRSYEIEVENHESIHDHNAYAYLARDKS